MTCPDCGEHVTRGKCQKCGWKEGERQGLPTWQGLPAYTKPKDTDSCGEWLPDGSLCQKTVREHIDECLAITSRPGTVFTRPSQRGVDPDPVREARRQELLAQAREILKAGEI